MPRKPHFTLPTINGRFFTWRDKDGTIEASTMARAHRPARVWNDSYDTGLYVESDRTGKKVLFLLDETRRREGDLLFETFMSLCGQFRITIFND